MTLREDPGVQFVDAGVLKVAYRDYGPSNGKNTVILLHGFPYDVHAYDAVVAALDPTHRIIVPYLRGYGPTRFLSSSTPRSGQQAVLGDDLRALMDALTIEQAVLAGYDWGGRAACIVSALWPGRVRGLVTGNGYNIQDIARAGRPAAPEDEHRYWYQYYFHSERGRRGLSENRYAYCKLLWSLWSPNWRFDEETYRQSAESFDNEDFVPVVIHSYRHRFGLVAGDPRVAEIEQRLSQKPPITVPTVSIDGGGDGVIASGGSARHAKFFAGPYQHRLIPSVGHNLPQEAPSEFAAAIASVLG